MTEPENAAAAPAMSRPTEDHLVDYESFNIFALGGLLMGLASVASLVDYLFWLIPAVGTLMSLYALWMFSHSDRKQVGRPLAIVGLCLSLFFLCAAPTSAYVERQYIRAEARAFADRWFEYLQHGDRARAYNMTLSNPSRDDDQQPPQRKVGEEEPISSYYAQHRWPRTLLDARENSLVEYVDTPEQTLHNGQYYVQHRYQIRLSKKNIPEPFALELERNKDYSTGQWHWRIVRLTREDERS